MGRPPTSSCTGEWPPGGVTSAPTWSVCCRPQRHRQRPPSRAASRHLRRGAGATPTDGVAASRCLGDRPGDGARRPLLPVVGGSAPLTPPEGQPSWPSRVGDGATVRVGPCDQTAVGAQASSPSRPPRAAASSHLRRCAGATPSDGVAASRCLGDRPGDGARRPDYQLSGLRPPTVQPLSVRKRTSRARLSPIPTVRRPASGPTHPRYADPAERLRPPGLPGLALARPSVKRCVPGPPPRTQAPSPSRPPRAAASSHLSRCAGATPSDGVAASRCLGDRPGDGARRPDYQLSGLRPPTVQPLSVRKRTSRARLSPIPTVRRPASGPTHPRYADPAGRLRPPGPPGLASARPSVLACVHRSPSRTQAACDRPGSWLVPPPPRRWSHTDRRRGCEQVPRRPAGRRGAPPFTTSCRGLRPPTVQPLSARKRASRARLSPIPTVR